MKGQIVPIKLSRPKSYGQDKIFNHLLFNYFTSKMLADLAYMHGVLGFTTSRLMTSQPPTFKLIRKISLPHSDKEDVCLHPPTVAMVRLFFLTFLLRPTLCKSITFFYILTWLLYHWNRGPTNVPTRHTFEKTHTVQNVVHKKNKIFIAFVWPWQHVKVAVSRKMFDSD